MTNWRTALRDHLEVTRGQVQRLERVFESMDMKARSKPCKGMKGIVEEGQEMLQEGLEEGVLDSAITGAARKVEHYEMMGYESVRAMAQQLGMREAAQMLQETLQEEMQADKQLAQISKRLLKESSSRRPEATTAKKGSTARKSSGGSKGSHMLTDPEEVREWAENRGAQPACVRGTGGKGDIGMLRLDFPGYTGEDSLQPIEWDEWLEKFEERGLALLVQEKTAGGQKSNFNKLVNRAGAAKPKTKTAR